jgi:hypothetical protein
MGIFVCVLQTSQAYAVKQTLLAFQALARMVEYVKAKEILSYATV